MPSQPRIRFIPTLGLLLLGLSGCVSTPERGIGAPVEDRRPNQETRSGYSVPARASAPEPKAQINRSTPAPVAKAEPIVRTAPAIRPRSARPIAPPRGSTGTTAVASLLNKAESSSSPNAAAATLERALRIEPNNPVVWNRLAEVRLDQGRLEQAEALALKSNALASNRPSLWPENWDIIARARAALGDPQGAAEAEAKSRSGTR